MQREEPRLKCRHCNAVWNRDGWEYCPECNRNFGGAIYPAKQTAEELAEINRLIVLIDDAFADVQIEDGTTLHEADLEGCYLDDSGRIAARVRDTGVDWRDVPDRKIELFGSALSFFDVKGWRFYIPAYMIWTLKNWRTTRSITADSVICDFTLEPISEKTYAPRFASLNTRQASVVAEFLQFFCDYSGEADADRAMASYWYQFKE
jgi:hypothetical protein